MSQVIRTGTVSSATHDMLITCAAAGSGLIKGEIPPVPRSSISNLKVIASNPNKYGELNATGAALATGAGASTVATLAGLSLVAGPAAPIAAILGGFATSPRLVTVFVVNSRDEDLEIDGSPALVHGIQTAHPAVQLYNPVSDEYSDGPANFIPGRKKDLSGEFRYGYGIWRFEKSPVSIAGLILPFSMYGVQGALMFKTKDGTKSGFGVAFENPENGENRIYTTTDGSAWKSIEDFVDRTVDDDKSKGFAAGKDIKVMGSIQAREFPDNSSTKDIVVTINIS